MSDIRDVVIVGAGFTGLAAGLKLARAGVKVTILESDSSPGGLAGMFEFKDGVRVEKFYHHWFTNDEYVPHFVRELGLEGQIVTMPSRTGMYYSGRHWRLSKPIDLLRFAPLPFLDRIRLGLLVFKVRRIKDWRSIEHLSIREWLEPLCGRTVYRIVWEPLIKAKFSIYADDVNAVWFWKKLVLRGSTRDKQGGEQLAYFKGGFGRLAEEAVKVFVAAGGEIRFNTSVTNFRAVGDKLNALSTTRGEIQAREFLFTPSFPIIGKIFQGSPHKAWLQQLSRVRYLGNMCLVLKLDRSLSETYWINVNDPGFPFVGVIEHTNFDSPQNYGGNRIAFLSKYLSTADTIWEYSDAQYLDFALQHLQRMFPQMKREWVIEYRVWRSEYAQPVTERDYSKYVPGKQTPYTNATICTMAHVYPEDRGTNYAIRDGQEIAEKILAQLR
jgi:protoporphyrinogen oxidase